MLRFKVFRPLPSTRLRHCHYLNQTSQEIVAKLPTLTSADIPSALFQLTKKDPKWNPDPTLSTLGPLLSKFKPRDIFYLFFVCKRAQKLDDEFWRALCVRAQTCSFTAIDLSGVLASIARTANRTKLQPFEVELVRYLVSEVKRRSSALDAQGIVNVLNSLSKIDMGNDEDEQENQKVMQILCEQAKSKVSELNSQGISNTLNALAQVGVENQELVEMLVEAAKKCTRYEPQHIANTLNALAKLDMFDRDLVLALVDMATNMYFQFNPQDIVNTLTALVKFQVWDASLMAVMITEITKKIEQFNPQDLSRAMRALSNFGVVDREVMGKLFIQVQKKSATFNEVDKNVTLQALRKWGIYDDKLTKEFQGRDFKELLVKTNANDLIGHLIDQAAKVNTEEFDADFAVQLTEQAHLMVAKFGASEVAKSLDALSRLFIYDEELVSRLINRIRNLGPKFTAHEIGITLLALVHFEELYDKPSLMRLVKMSHSRIGEFKPTGIVNVFTALAKYDKNDRPLIAKLTARAELQALDFTPQEISRFFRSLATFPVKKKPAFPQLIAAAKLKRAEFTEEQVDETLRSLATLKIHDNDLLDALKPNRKKKKKKLILVVENTRTRNKSNKHNDTNNKRQTTKREQPDTDTDERQRLRKKLQELTQQANQQRIAIRQQKGGLNEERKKTRRAEK